MDPHTQRRRDGREMPERGIAHPALDVAEIHAVDRRPPRQLFLGPAAGEPERADTPTEAQRDRREIRRLWGAIVRHLPSVGRWWASIATYTPSL